MKDDFNKVEFFVSPSGKIHASLNAFNGRAHGFCGYRRGFNDEQLEPAQAIGSVDFCKRCATKYNAILQGELSTALKPEGRGGARPGAGRPEAAPGRRRSCKVYARATQDELQFIFDAAETVKEGLSEFVRKACLKRAKEINPQTQLFELD